MGDYYTIADLFGTLRKNTVCQKVQLTVVFLFDYPGFSAVGMSIRILILDINDTYYIF